MSKLLDAAIEVLLVALLTFMPLAFGAVEPWSELVALTMGALLALLVALRQVIQPRSLRAAKWALVAVVAYLVLAFAQLMTLPLGVIELVSPSTYQVKSDLLLDVPHAQDVVRRISFYPNDTRHDLRIVLLACSVLLAAVIVFQSPQRIRRLMLWLTLIGALIAGIALLQDLTAAPGIYWRTRMAEPAHSGPFVNHSHFAQFMNLCVGSALGLLFMSLARSSDVKRAAWWTVPVITAALLAIALSLTRGGMVSALIAGTFTMLALIWRRGLRHGGVVIAVIAVVALAGITVAGFDRVYEQIRSVTSPGSYRGRAQMVADALLIWRKFPVTGIGLGAHSVVFPGYERQIDPTRATHVENEYAQTLEEMGVIGFVCVLWFVVTVWSGYFRAIRRSDIGDAATAIGLGYGLLAVMIHSLSDYGQHIPAVACMSAATCGLLINLGKNETQQRPGRRVASIPMILLVTIISIWIITYAVRERRADRAWNSAQRIARSLHAHDWLGSDEQFQKLLSESSIAIALQPDNIVYRHWQGSYRYRAMTRHRNASGQPVLNTAEVQELRRIIQDLNDARRLCPTYGPIYYFTGELEAILNLPQASAHIARGFELAPNDDQACMLAARWDAKAGRWDDANRKFRRAIQLNPAVFDEVMRFYLEKFQRPDMALKLYWDDPWELIRFVEWTSSKLSTQELRDQALARALDLLQRRIAQGQTTSQNYGSLGQVHLARNEFTAAAEAYGNLLKLDYGRVDVHFLRARCLQLGGNLDEARQEAAIVLRFDPNNAGAKQMLKELDQAR